MAHPRWEMPRLPERHLILGGLGFLGRYVARALCKQNDTEVVIGSRRDEPDPEILAAIRGDRAVKYCQVDLLTADWDEILRDVDVIHHYAWQSVPATADANLLEDFNVHVAGTLRLLDAARRLGGKRIIFLSSGGTVYGRLEHDVAHEDDALRPIGSYGGGKVAVETYLRIYHVAGWVNARVARLSNPYGIGQPIDRAQGVLGAFLRAALAGRPLHVWGDGNTVRDYIHVTDAAEGILRMLRADLSGSAGMPVFNIGSGIGTSINQLIATIQQEFGPLEVIHGRSKPYDVRVSVLDVGAASQVLNFLPLVDLADGIASTIADLKAGKTIVSSLA